MKTQGYIIYRTRMQRNWSQAGLCKGICTVSYLSKIEAGKAEPSEEIMRLLMERLGLKSDPEIVKEASALAEQGWELMLSGRFAQLSELMQGRDITRYQAVPAWLDLALLSSSKPLDPALEVCMDTRQLALQRILQGQESEAVRLTPNAYTFLALGMSEYKLGNYSAAVDTLQTAYDLASREGAVRIMLEAKLFLGNAYCNQQDLPNMERHYRVARRLAEDLQDQRALYAIGYNTASAWIETERYEDAYTWFSHQEQPTLMTLHKLAICCEKTGRREEALHTLEQAEAMDTDELDPALAMRLLALVRYRVEHPNHLAQEEYGALLLESFTRLRKELPSGFAQFHLPWVLEWYKATRQYKKACELLEKFPIKSL
ncbi:MAG: helix-turn-helix domain-containing protein [Clostridia bacterium]|nr:helix-turn-helix domain-containing protein [Clostridia bacterium]